MSESKNILRLPEVIKRVGLPRSSIYMAIKEGRFPSQISLSPNCVGWLESEIDSWCEDRIKQSRPNAKEQGEGNHE